MPHSEHLHRRRGRRAHSPLRQYRHHKRHPKHHRTATLLLFLLALVLASVASPHGIPMSVPIITGGTEQQQHPHHPHVSSNHRLPRPRSFPDTPAHGCMLPAPHMLPSESSSTSPQSLLARLGRRLPGHQNAFHLSGGDSGAGDAAPEPVHSQFRVPNWSASSPPLRGSDATSQSNDENTWSASAAAGASGDAFVVDFECVRPPNSDPTYCARVQRAISRSCARVASEIKFKVPVRVAAVLFLPCDSPRPSASCPESHVLGSGAALQSWPVRHLDDKQVYMYPSALVKQLDLHPAQDTEGQTVRWPEFDVLVRFNSLVEFWFGDSDNNGEKRDLAASERDFEYAFTHELLHGLGFGEDLLMRQVPDPRGALLAPSWESTPPSVVPAPMEFSVPWSIYSAETAFFRFARPSIWNRFTFVNGSNPLPAAAARLNDLVDSRIASGLLLPIPPHSPHAPAIPELTVPDPRSRDPAATITATDPVYRPRDVFRSLLSGGDSVERAAREVMGQLYAAGTGGGGSGVVFDASAWPPPSPPPLAGSAQAPMRKTPLVLETSILPFAPGSSLAHVHVPAAQSVLGGAEKTVDQDFLMGWHSPAGVSLDTMASRAGITASGIGPGIVRALRALGYTPARVGAWTSRRDVAEMVESSAPSPPPAAPRRPRTDARNRPPRTGVRAEHHDGDGDAVTAWRLVGGEGDRTVWQAVGAVGLLAVAVSVAQWIRAAQRAKAGGARRVPLMSAA